MPQILEVHRVFVASPSDVMAERTAALDVVNRLNTMILAGQGKLIHLTGWEYLAPAAGRPQDLINGLVDECDVFVGLLHERWGTPTGEWSSGFEEEFHRADRRRGLSGQPRMAMFFKTPSSQTAASRDDYQRIARFRESISQTHMYETVDSTAEWRERLSSFLMSVVAIGPAAPPRPNDTHLRRELRDAISRLDEREQTFLGLYYFEGMTIAQIASILGIDEKVASHIHTRAILRLRTKLEEKGLDLASIPRN